MNIAIIFGGKSVEHDISILTALHAAKHVMEDKRVHLVYLSRENEIVVGRALGNLDFYTSRKGRVNRAWFGDGCLYKRASFGRVKKVAKIDCVINCCHGGVGENGSIAALMDIAGIPVTSPPLHSAANIMSKSMTRDILGMAGFVQPDFNVYSDVDALREAKFPVIVKPDALGSSIGISVAQDELELKAAVELAFSLDNKVIVEEFIVDAVEVNCSAFMHGGKILISECEVMNKKDKKGLDMLAFEDKYLDADSGFIKKSGEEEEKVDPKMLAVFEEVGKLTKKAYEIFELGGVVRADFLVADGRVILNEINAPPGFLAYHLWMKGGIPYGALLDLLVEEAMSNREKRLCTTFESDVLGQNRALVD